MTGDADAATLGDRLHAWLAGRARPPAEPLLPPGPRPAGDAARGRLLLAGRIRIGAEVVDAPGRAIWDLGGPEDPNAVAFHACGWLDDLAALGTAPARTLAQGWVAEWIARYGRGGGPGWTPELAADRTLRWIGHGGFLLRGRERAAQRELATSIARQALFLSRRWHQAPPGRPRLAALAALIQAGLALPALRARGEAAAAALGREAATAIDAAGAVPSRDPEDLLDALALLTWSAEALAGAGLAVPPGLGAAIARAAPTLRALRHADGGLARFHGGDRGTEGRLDQALAAAGRPAIAGGRLGRGPGSPGGAATLHMGFARMSAARTTVIVDAARPPQGTHGHASTLAIELTSGRRPVIVSCGPGRSFGPAWRRAARATASHSTLALEGASSSRLAPDGRLTDGPARVIAEATPLSGGRRMELAHDGWRPSHGLTHARILELAPDGRELRGEDVLTTLTAADAPVFDRALDAAPHLGLAFAIRFHLHPEAEADLGADGSGRIVLPSGEAWTFRHEGGGTLSIEPSVHLEDVAPGPAPAWQLVVSGRAMAYSTAVRWRLAKDEGTPPGLRDLVPARAPWREEGGRGGDDQGEVG